MAGEKNVNTIKLDPTVKPKTIDNTFPDGPQKGQLYRGIYKLEGDTLTLCVNNENGGPRPKEFLSKPDSTIGIVVLKKQKP